jgi:hypothetical protein
MKLHLVLKHKWFDMIASGEKLEEYRDIKPYWENRLFTFEDPNFSTKLVPIKYDSIVFHRAYTSTTIEVEYKGLEVGLSNPYWSENNEFKRCFILKLGQILPPQYRNEK